MRAVKNYTTPTERILQTFLLSVVFLCSIFLTQCSEPSENDALLNAPVGQDSIRVRLFNFGGSRDSLSLSLEDGQSTLPTGYTALSGVIGSSLDSSKITIINAGTGQTKYVSTIRTRFQRNSYQTVLALSGAYGDTPREDVDTLIVLSAEVNPRFSTNPEAALLRFVNAVPERNFEYTLRLGCPNGEAIALRTGYTGVSAYKEFAEGEIIVSLVRTRVSTGENRIEGFFRLNLSKRSSSAFLIFEGEDGVVALLVNERAPTATAVQVLERVEESRADLRIANLTNSPVTLVQTPGTVIHQNQSSYELGGYKPITACLSESPDTLLAISNGDTAIASATLNILGRYTAFIAETATGKKTIAIAPELLPIERPRKHAVLRVMNLIDDTTKITIASGTRSIGSDSSLKAQLIATNLSYKQISKPLEIVEGTLPMTIFSVGSVTRLLSSVIASTEEERSYIVAIQRNRQGAIEAFLTDDADVVQRLQPVQAGIFTQLVNGNTGSAALAVTASPVLTSITVAEGDNIATVLPSDVPTTIAIGNGSTVIEQTSSERLLVVASGNEATPILSAFKYAPIISTANQVRWRIFNMATDVESLHISADSIASRERFVENLGLQQFILPTPLVLDRRISLVFWTPAAADKPLARLNNLQLLLGKSYSLVFYGNAQKGYKTIVLEEF